MGYVFPAPGEEKPLNRFISQYCNDDESNGDVSQCQISIHSTFKEREREREGNVQTTCKQIHTFKGQEKTEHDKRKPFIPESKGRNY